MPTAEEEAAAKAAADKAADKAAADAKSAAAGGATETVESLKAHVHTLNTENAQRRKEAAAQKTENDRLAAALKALGKDPAAEPPDPAKVKEQQGQAKLRDLLLRSVFVQESGKHGIVDAAFAFKALKAEMADVPVDIDAETVDVAALSTKITGFKTAHPFLFKTAAPAQPPKTGAPPVPGRPAPDGNGAPNTGDDHYAVWKQMKDAGNTQGATEYYRKHAPAIRAGQQKR